MHREDRQATWSEREVDHREVRGPGVAGPVAAIFCTMILWEVRVENTRVGWGTPGRPLKKDTTAALSRAVVREARPTLAGVVSMVLPFHENTPRVGAYASLVFHWGKVVRVSTVPPHVCPAPTSTPSGKLAVATKMVGLEAYALKVWVTVVTGEGEEVVSV